jgi:hypothetical protein
MPVSRNRKAQKKKAQARRNEIKARRNKVTKLVGELQQEFAKLEAPVPTYTPAPGSGTYLTATEIDLTQL